MHCNYYQNSFQVRYSNPWPLTIELQLACQRPRNSVAGLVADSWLVSPRMASWTCYLCKGGPNLHTLRFKTAEMLMSPCAKAQWWQVSVRTFRWSTVKLEQEVTWFLWLGSLLYRRLQVFGENCTRKKACFILEYGVWFLPWILMTEVSIENSFATSQQLVLRVVIKADLRTTIPLSFHLI